MSSGEFKSKVQSFTAGRDIESQVPRPERTKGKTGGSMDTPTSTQSNIVAPAPPGPKVTEPMIANKGA